MSKPMPAAIQAQAEAVELMDAEIAATITPPPPAEDPPAAPPPEPPPAQVVDWEQKFKSLQGMFNTQVPALQADVKDLKEKLELATKSPPEPKPAPAAPVSTVTDADLEAFGPDLVDLIKRIVAQEKAPLLSEIERLQGQVPGLAEDVKTVKEVQTLDARDAYFAKVGEKVTDWEAINVDPAFTDWLDGADALSGQTYKALLGEAFNTFDHTRTAAVFNAFKATRTPAPAPAPTPAPTPAPKPDLEAEISPGSSRSVSTPTPDDGQKIWTSAEVHDFYTARTRGDYRGRDADAAKIDADIDKALVEGRVRG